MAPTMVCDSPPNYNIRPLDIKLILTIILTVANAVGPWVASYNTYTTGEVTAKADTPIWILVTAGLLLSVGFWSK